MAYDNTIATRLRELLADHTTVEKSTVDGGLAFLVNGELCLSIGVKGLAVRLGREGIREAGKLDHVGPLVTDGRTSASFVLVQPEAYNPDGVLVSWVEQALAFNATLSGNA